MKKSRSRQRIAELTGEQRQETVENDSIMFLNRTEEERERRRVADRQQIAELTEDQRQRRLKNEQKRRKERCFYGVQNGQYFNVGEMNVECPHCGALHFQYE